MNIQNMRAYVARRYKSLKAKGGGLTPTSKAPSNQIVAVYYQIKAREAKLKQASKPVEKQLNFQF